MDVKTRAQKGSLTPSGVRQREPRITVDVEPTGPLGPAARRFALSPINRRRWRNFATNRRGYWSLWVFLVLFVVTLFAEFIANDRPLYVRYDGKSYFPVFFAYPETAFGGDGAGVGRSRLCVA